MRFSVKAKRSRKSKRVLYKKNPSVCKIYKKSRCGSVDPSCNWRKSGTKHKKGRCVRRSKALRTKVQYAGPKWQSPKKISSLSSVNSFML